VVAALPILALLGSGCQSTQATSAEREAEGKKLLAKDKGLKITKVNPDVKVVDSTLLSDKNGSAVVVEVKNTSDQGFADVPIAIDVRDAKGKTVFENDIAGLEPALTSVPIVAGGATVDWVNDQVLATGKPDSVKVKVGASEEKLPATLPEIEVSKPKLEVDRYSGAQATGTAENKSQIDQTNLKLFAVARKDGEVVAAGRGGLRRLPADAGRATPYHIFFIGDPEGADIEVTLFPAQLR